MMSPGPGDSPTVAQKATLRFATLEELERVIATVREITKQVETITHNTERTALSVETIQKGYTEVRGWLEGSTSPVGVRSEGLLGQFSQFITWKDRIIAIGIAGSAGAVSTAAIAGFRLFHDYFGGSIHSP